MRLITDERKIHVKYSNNKITDLKLTFTAKNKPRFLILTKTVLFTNSAARA